MKSIVRKLAKPFLSRYNTLKRRIHDIEIVQNTLLFDKIWVNDSAKFLNGQIMRQSLILHLREVFNFTIIIETGTFLGNTTGWFADLWRGGEIHTCEIDPRFHSLAKMRCVNMNINFFCGDSRTFLDTLSRPKNSQIAFIYLDAHWSDDLPLMQELMIIKEKWPRSVIMIDDFEVPNDQGYSYDDYGPGKSLTFKDFNSFFIENSFFTYSPSIRSADETGPKRGMVLLTLDSSLSKYLDAMPNLYRHK